MRGNLVEMTIGDYIHYQPCIMTNLYIGIPEEANWEIGLGDAPGAPKIKDQDVHELPMLLKCSMNFIPLYNFLPRKSAHAPFFGIDDPKGTTENTPRNWTYKIDDYLKKKQ